MKDKEIDEILKQAAQASHPVDPALLDRISQSVGSSLRPVRPLAPAWMLASGLALTSVAVAVGGAVRLGLFGFHKLSLLERFTIFPVLGMLIVLLAAASASAMIPGSRRRLPAWTLPGGGILALLAVFALLFRDYHTERFVAQGMVCLTAGLLHAAPAGLAGWLLLRRGFAVNSVAAGLLLGALSGLAGVGMLELHCANFEAPHVMLWHTAVLLVSAAAGALIGWAGRLRTR